MSGLTTQKAWQAPALHVAPIRGKERTRPSPTWLVWDLIEIKPRRCHLLRATPPIATGADHQRRARLAPLHFWLTNRINIPTAINRATRVPTASERTRFRRSSGFDPAPFCAAPMPNQKRNLSIERYLAQNRRCFPPEFGMMLSEALAKLNRRTAQ